MTRYVTSSAIILGMVLATAAAMNCSSDKPSGTQVENTGAVGMQLQVGNVTINSVHYVLTNGTNTLTGDVDVASATTLTFVIGNVPAGTGYTLTITATEVGAGGAVCSGSSGTFSVTAGQTTTEGIELVCRRPRGTGSVLVNGTTNECPSILSVSADPSVGNTIALHVNAVDPDNAPQPLVITWIGAGISDIHSANPTLTCSAAGLTNLTVTASDGDVAADCVDSFTLTVVCPAGSATTTTTAATTTTTVATTTVATTTAATTTAGAGGAGGGGGAAAGAGGLAAGAGGAAAGAGGTTGGGGSGGVITTASILTSRGPDCLSCATDNGCLDPAAAGGTCEGTPGTAPAACATPLGLTGSVSETQVCLKALSDIFTSACAATQQLTPCLCGATDAGQCLAGTLPPTGPLLPVYQCELGTTAAQISANFTVQTFGAGQANALAQCAGAFGCSCF